MTKSLGLLEFKGAGRPPADDTPARQGLASRFFGLFFPAFLVGATFLTAHIFFGF